MFSTYLLIGGIAALASCLTFFSGFGLGTLLLPAFAVFFPVEHAVAMTAVVHLLNGLFKAALIGRHARSAIVVRFGIPAILAALLGAWVLQRLTHLPPLFRYVAFDATLHVTPVKVTVGALLLAFALFELVPRWRDSTFSARWIPIGGVLSGFFGGLAGMQGALRSAFLMRAGLDKHAFVATGVVIAVLIDLARLGVYTPTVMNVWPSLDMGLLGTAVLAAFVGALAGNWLLEKVTLPWLQRFVAVALSLAAFALIAGVI